MSGEMLQAALENARRGFRVFPLKPGQKTPAHRGWQQEATTDEQVIRQLWNGTDYGVGIATGDGLVVADVDVKDGRRGYETLRRLGLPTDTFSRSTPSGGLHLYYQGDARNSVQRLGEGLDVRGRGGYVVAAPGYRVSSERSLCAAPSALTTAPQRRVPSAPSTPITLDTPAAVDRGIAYLTGSAHLAIEGAGGDHTTFVVACTLKDFGLSEFMAWELMVEHWNDRCSPPWDLNDLETKVRNAFAYGENPPGALSVEADFAGVPPIMAPAPLKGIWSYADDPVSLDQKWLYYRLLGPSGVCLLIGESQSGKTFLATELARSLATRKPFFGIEPDEIGASLFLFAGSEGAGFEYRLKALQEEARLPIAWRTVWNLRDKTTMEGLASDLIAQKEIMLRRFGAPLRLIFLETLSASGLIEKENDNSQAAQAMETLGRLGALLDVLFIVSHHPAKNGDEGPRGAGALIGSPDYVLSIHREGRSDIRDFELVKGRNVQQRPIGSFSLVEVEIGIDDRERPVTSMALSMGEVQTKAQRIGQYFQILVEAFDLSENIVEHADKLWTAESDWKASFCAHDRSKDAGERRRRFQSAMKAAKDQGLIERVMLDTGEVARIRSFIDE